MCGVVGYIGQVDKTLLDKIVFESTIRGLHNLGSRIEDGAGIYHTRYCTSGETNQPLHHNGRWLAFNGVINMGTKEEMEREYGIEMETDNDGEVILRLCKDEFEARLFLKSTKASFAGLWLESNRLVAIRNTRRPLWMHEAANGSVLLASTKDIFRRAGVINNLKELEPLEIYEWSF